MIEKFALGTVQIGLKYGINNQGGQVSSEDAKEILRLCEKHGIDTIDTAYGYGESENVLGTLGVNQFRVISKLPPCKKEQVSSLINVSLERLQLSSLSGYMLHNFSIYKSDKSIWSELIKARKEGKVKKIGVSLYAPDELEILLEDGVDFDMVQIPYNIFDRRFESYFSILKDKKIEIHTRSSFLQGLFFKSLEDLPPHFNQVKPQLTKLKEIASESGRTIADLCLGFAVSHQEIDKVVIGVDSSQQLSENIQSILSLSKNFDRTLFSGLSVTDETIINPSLWQL